MGLLVKGTPLDWPKALAHLKYVRQHGVTQFINLYQKMLNRSNDVLLWGDEIEYMIVKFDETTGKAVLSLKATPVIEHLEAEEKALGSKSETAWRPEYGEWMVEAVPSNPYGGYTLSLQDVERNIQLRQQRIQAALDDDERVLSIVAFPTFGVGTFTHPPLSAGGNVSQSLYVPDGCINPHPRFATLTANIRQRRGSKVSIQVPLFQDELTPEFATTNKSRTNSADSSSVVFSMDMGDDDSSSPSDSVNTAKTTTTTSTVACELETQQPMIDMDCMAFGMGCCCLQVTFQARNLDESRQLYDQLAILAPMLLALTAGCPILKGRLADTDVRWNVIAGSVDDRTPAERNVSPSGVGGDVSERGGTVEGPGLSPITKSRYEAIDLFIGNTGHADPKFNDVDAEVDEESLQTLLGAGIDPVLAQHIARLFIRDPLVIFEHAVELDDAESSDHFENIQSTNWQTVRWKPPPVNSSIGWRVEFRSMEAQLTSYENAAFTVFIGLVSRVILFFDLNLYMPMSKVNENMEFAHVRGAATKGMFHFRRNVVPLSSECGTGAEDAGGNPNNAQQGETKSASSSADRVERMSILEILMGKRVDTATNVNDQQYFPGLVPLLHAYLDIIDCDVETRRIVDDYLEFICQRASGELVTTATWMRNFVSAHPEYKFDSVVTEKIAYDLLQKCVGISQGTVRVPELFGSFGNFNTGSDESSSNNVAPTVASLLPARRMLRGSSFRDEVKTITQCSLVRALIGKYSSKAQQHKVKAESGFANTKAFLATATQ
jgi:glutamate--cysteine ligase catalytic subunit